MRQIWPLIGVVVACIALVAAWRLTWLRAYGVTVIYNGSPLPDARVYRHRGDMLVDLGRPSRLAYIIRSQEKSVGIPGNSFIAMTGIFALAKEDPVLVVDMRSGKNDGRDPKLAITPKFATFVDNDGRAVQLEW